ncbi:MAG: orotate phosphoribosyltransferase [Candidatus Bathyarchaeia archaeon]
MQIENALTSERISDLATALIRSEALKFGSFKLKSGVISPYYIDLSALLSSPASFKCVVNIVAEKVKEIASSLRPNKLASIELKGALLLPSIACELEMPCFVVRKESKSYGLTGRIAGGEVKEGDRVLFFDDVVTDARSKIEGIQPIERLGAKVCAIVVVVDREQGGGENLEKMGYELYSVATISEIIKNLLSSHAISEEQAKRILNYTRENITSASSGI